MFYLCKICRAMLFPQKEKYIVQEKIIYFQCPSCGLKHFERREDKYESLDEEIYYFDQDLNWFFVKHGILIDHVKQDVSASGSHTIGNLFSALAMAHSFIHICTYGLSPYILGALTLASTRARVYGFVSNVSKSVDSQIRESSREGRLNLVTFPKGYPHTEVPHSKYVIVDGEIAFEGSANLTVSGLRKADKRLDKFYRVNDKSDIIELNNSYFSPIWMQYQKRYSEINIETLEEA